MSKIIVSDTSCLILFSKIDELDLLRKIFSKIWITTIVANESNIELPDWINVKDPKSNLHLGLKSILDLGEATSISLAFENENSLLIIDELKGRRIAKDIGISITGTLGILLIGKQKGIVPQVKPIIEKIQKTNFRISQSLIDKTLKMAEEN